MKVKILTKIPIFCYVFGFISRMFEAIFFFFFFFFNRRLIEFVFVYLEYISFENYERQTIEIKDLFHGELQSEKKESFLALSVLKGIKVFIRTKLTSIDLVLCFDNMFMFLSTE